MLNRSPQWDTAAIDIDDEDIASPDFFTRDRHFEVWQAARQSHPIAWVGSSRVGEFWSVTSHGLGNQVLRQPGLFSSAQGMRLGGNPVGVQVAANRMLVVSDGDIHRALRAAHSAWFNSRAVSAFLPDMERVVESLLDEILAAGTCDIVKEVAVKLPTWVLFEMMKVPDSDRDELVRLTATAFDDSDDSVTAAQDRIVAHTGIFAYFADLLSQRRAHPDTDMVTSLAQATVDGRPLTDDEVILNCDGLVNGGLETTPHAISGAFLAFAQHPGEWRRLKDDPELVSTAVEEVLRWTSPAMHAMRTASADTEIGAAQIQAGDPVAVWLPSCNRDENVFQDADRFLIDRRPNPHVAFGAGPHHCAAALLGRAELRCLLAAMARLIDSIEVTGEPVRQRSNFLNGLTRLDVRVSPARRG